MDQLQSESTNVVSKQSNLLMISSTSRWTSRFSIRFFLHRHQAPIPMISTPTTPLNTLNCIQPDCMLYKPLDLKSSNAMLYTSTDKSADIIWPLPCLYTIDSTMTLTEADKLWCRNHLDMSTRQSLALDWCQQEIWANAHEMLESL